MDVLVVPSIWPENSPFVIQEALLSGVPVVASRIGGIPELVDDGRNGLLFEPRDVDGSAPRAARLLDEPGLLDTLGAGARATTFRTLDDDVARRPCAVRVAGGATRAGRPARRPVAPHRRRGA